VEPYRPDDPSVIFSADRQEGREATGGGLPVVFPVLRRLVIGLADHRAFDRLDKNRVNYHDLFSLIQDYV